MWQQMAIIIIAFTVAILTVATLAIYREVGTQQRRADIESRWPFKGLAAGSRLPIPHGEDDFTGFVVLCSDDNDALAAIFAVSVVAEQWCQPIMVIVGRTARPTEWYSSARPDPRSEWMFADMAPIQALSPSRLPVAIFMRDGQILDASIGLSSPSIVAARFEYVAAPLEAPHQRTIQWP